ncbi:MAG: alpha/beta hydrolase [Calditrichaceae bacterium]
MKTLLLLLILNFSASACMLDTEIRISGQIINAKSDKIKIGETIVPISKDGRFLFISETDSPVFFDIVYDQLTWPVYLEPGKTVDLSSDGINLDSICYKKDLTNENSYLLTTLKTNESLNAYFNQNWYPLHAGSESALIYAIDSLKQLYLVDLEKYQVSKKFTEMFTAALNFSLDSFILQYPGRHLEFTGEKILLSREAMDYIDIKDLQNAEMCDLTTYEEFGRNYIDYQIDNAYREFRGKKHYNLWKMDKIFGFIKKTFKDQYLSDFWISKYLADHISFTGVANSRLFVEKFSDICKTEEFKSTVQSTYNNAVRKRQDHTIKIYKNVNGFKLEAHIFYPEDMNNNIKRPAVAIFHGGGWTTGTPEWAFNLSRHYAGYGMIGIAVQYRLSNYHDITPIEAMEDARDLIKWLRINSDSLGILPHKIAFEGWSAGGHLVTCAAVFPDTLENIKINSVPDAL